MSHLLKQRLIGATALVVFIAVVIPIILNGNEDKFDITENLVREKQFIEGERRVIELDLYHDFPITENSDSKFRLYFSIFKAKLNKVWGNIILFAENKEIDVSNVDRNYNANRNSDTWSVQLGSFISLENARQRIAILRDKEYNAYVTEHLKNDQNIYKVKIGTNLTEREAKRVSGVLLDAGYENQIVPYE